MVLIKLLHADIRRLEVALITRLSVPEMDKIIENSTNPSDIATVMYQQYLM